MGERFDIVISGASFAGLSLAKALSVTTDGEVRVALVDPGPAGVGGSADVAQDNPRAFAVAAASRNLLEALGVWPSVAKSAQPVLRIEITDSPLEAGLRPALLSYENMTDEGDPASFIVPDPVLQRALRGAALHAPGVTHMAGTSISRQGLDPSSGLMSVELDDGRAIETSLLVGAEGRASPTRKRAGIGIVSRDYEQDGICARVAFEAGHEATAVQHFLPGGPFAVLPLPGHAACVTWSEERGLARRLMSGPDEDLHAALTARIGGRYGAVEIQGLAQSWPLSMHLARTFIGDRLALVADAARGVHPIAGQGLNLGLRDVAALTEVIVDAVGLGLDIGAPDDLARYERWRRFDSTLSSAAFDRLNGLFSNDWTLLRSVREAGLGLVDRMPFVKQAFVTEAAGLSGDVPKLLRGEML